MAKLSNKIKPAKGVKLTPRISAPFILAFRERLKNHYTFAQMDAKQNRDFQRFLDKVSNMDFEQVDNLYRRHSDANDKYKGEQIIHYEVTRTFRIHGIIENGLFMVLRIDPNHYYHEG